MPEQEGGSGLEIDVLQRGGKEREKGGGSGKEKGEKEKEKEREKEKTVEVTWRLQFSSKWDYRFWTTGFVSLFFFNGL